jgi:HEPN domain-containing protein
MGNRAQDWFGQAEHDLAQAQDSLKAERHDWACFASQQAAEKAVKALHLHLGQEAWGHVVARLLQDLPGTVGVPAGLVDQARVLDNFYIPTRYPNGHPVGAPFEHYGPLQSTEAVKHAGAIIDFVRNEMAR